MKGSAKLATLLIILVASCLVGWLLLPSKGSDAGGPSAARVGANDEFSAVDLKGHSGPDELGDDPASDGRSDRIAAVVGETSSAFSAERKEDAIKGVVRTSLGAPIPGALVQIECSRGRSNNLLVLSYSRLQEVLAETTTDADGRFVLPARPGQSHRLKASYSGLASARVQDIPAGSFVVLELAPSAILEGTLIYADGNPLANGDMRGWDQSSRVELFRGTSDGMGRFRFDDLPACAGRIAIEAASGSVPWYDVNLVAGETTKLDIEIPLGVRIFGQVTEAEGQAPIVGARVGLGWVMNQPVLTDQDGWYEIPHYAGVGHFEMAVEAVGFGRSEAPLVVPQGEDLRRDFQLLKGFRAEGRVVDANRTPIEGVVILSQGESGEGLDLAEARSDAQGIFNFDSLRPDSTHMLLFQHADFGERLMDLVGEPDNGRTFYLGDIELLEQAAIVGRVVDETGSPWAGVSIRISDHSPEARGALERAGVQGYSESRFARRVWSDDTGRFHASGLGAGSHRIVAKVPNSSAEQSKMVTLLAGKRHEEIELVLERGLLVRGIVVDPDGQPVVGATVRLFQSGGTWSRVTMQTGSDGTFALRPDKNAAAATQDGASESNPIGLQVEQEGWSLAPGTPKLASVFVQNVDPTDDTQHRIVLPQAVAIEGLVLESDGSPADHAWVEIKQDVADPYERNASTSTDTEGHFTLWVAPGRTLELLASGTKRDEDDLSGFDLDSERPRTAETSTIDAGTAGRSGLLLRLFDTPKDD